MKIFVRALKISPHNEFLTIVDIGSTCKWLIHIWLPRKLNVDLTKIAHESGKDTKYLKLVFYCVHLKLWDQGLVFWSVDTGSVSCGTSQFRVPAYRYCHQYNLPFTELIYSPINLLHRLISSRDKQSKGFRLKEKKLQLLCEILNNQVGLVGKNFPFGITGDSIVD